MGCAQLIRLIMLAATCWRCGKPKARCRRIIRVAVEAQLQCTYERLNTALQNRARERHAGRHASQALSQAEVEGRRLAHSWRMPENPKMRRWLIGALTKWRST
jgi:hypothetical protein